VTRHREISDPVLYVLADWRNEVAWPEPGFTVSHRTPAGGTVTGVPTSYRRIQVTETPALTQAIQIGALTWPDAPLSQVVARLAEVGAQTIGTTEALERERHRALVTRFAGRYAEFYGPDYLRDLREDWPE
jgi:hypothetical protein